MLKCLSVLVALTLLCSITYAQTHRDAAKEQAITNRLAAVAPAAVGPFQQATAALDQHDYTEAAQLFTDVVKQAPNFAPALRRLGSCLAESGKTEEGLAYARQAVAIERSPENLASLARTLAFPSDKTRGTQRQTEEALSLMREALQRAQGGDDPSYATLMAQIALGLSRPSDFRSALQILQTKFPNEMVTHLFAGVEDEMEGKWVAAEDEIEEAERLGLPKEEAERILNSGIRTRARIWRTIHYGLYLLAAWAVGLFVLFLTGKAFSKLTLSHLENADVNGAINGKELTLRKYYRQLINFAGIYYYISLPFVIVLVIGIAAGIIYGFLVIGEVPIKLVAILVIGALATIYKMIHSLFVRVKSEDPGRALKREEAPGLWNLTREVAEKLGTRPLDEIRVTTGTEMAVYERGSSRERREDRSRRTLLLGVGLLPGFDQNPFRAVLAHEYGHLSHRDTAGGDVALRVNQDMIKFALAMARVGQAVWWNVAFQFLRLYHFLFRRISHGATRLQEVLADRAAARLYGPQQFEEGLRHVVRRGIEFNHIARTEIRDAMQSGRALQNLYSLKIEPDQSVSQSIEEAIQRPTSEDDTHPSPVDRFRLVSRIAGENKPAPSAPVWDLFVDPGSLTEEMNSQIEGRVKASAT